MNFIPGRVAAVEGKKVALHMLGAQLSFQAREALPSLPQEVVVGVRPEFITLNQGGGLPGKVYSPCPPVWKPRCGSAWRIPWSPAWCSAASITRWIAR